MGGRYLIVVTKRYVRVYDLQAQVLKQKLMSGVQHLSSVAVHPSGDHIICGSYGAPHLIAHATPTQD